MKAQSMFVAVAGCVLIWAVFVEAQSGSCYGPDRRTDAWYQETPHWCGPTTVAWVMSAFNTLPYPCDLVSDLCVINGGSGCVCCHWTYPCSFHYYTDGQIYSAMRSQWGFYWRLGDPLFIPEPPTIEALQLQYLCSLGVNEPYLLVSCQPNSATQAPGHMIGVYGYSIIPPSIQEVYLMDPGGSGITTLSYNELIVGSTGVNPDHWWGSWGNTIAIDEFIGVYVGLDDIGYYW